MPARARPWILGVLVTLAVVAAAVLPVRAWLLGAGGWIRGAGPLGIVAYAGLYVGATVALAPGSVLTILAGFAWGWAKGTAIALPSATLGATASFLVGRSAARPWVERRVGSDPRRNAIDRAIARGGARVVGLLRLSPLLPFNLLNYALSLTGVRLRDYVLGSLVGMLPGAALYAYVGAVATDIATAEVPAPGRIALLVLGGVATLAVAVLLGRYAREELARAGASEAPPNTPESR